MSTIAIDVLHVSKSFTIHARSDATMLSRMADLMPSEKKRHTTRFIRALRDVSFQVEKGEVLGVIGKNASGKSSLLRMIAGILYPDEGTVDVQGAITPLISLNVGVKPRLTITDNIFLACSLYGMPQGDISSTLDSIIEFAGIEEFVDMYPYQLSTGMGQRLAFSIAVHTNPEILLLDEVFSAGDMFFQERAAQRMTQLIQGNVTVIMVSHSMERIESVCDKVLWLEKGKMREIGDPKTVIENYVKDSQSKVLKV